eukprot:600455-Prymnesium_polylepis.1
MGSTAGVLFAPPALSFPRPAVGEAKPANGLEATLRRELAGCVVAVVGADPCADHSPVARSA